MSAKRRVLKGSAEVRAEMDRRARKAGYRDFLHWKAASDEEAERRAAARLENDPVRQREADASRARRKRERAAQSAGQDARLQNVAPQAATLAGGGRRFSVVDVEAGEDAAGGTRTLRDLSSCPVLKLSRKGTISAAGVRAALRFNALVQFVLAGAPGPSTVRWDDPAGEGDLPQEAHADAGAEHRKVREALSEWEYGMLDRVMRYGYTLQAAADEVFRARWADKNARSAAGQLSLETGCRRLAQLWGLGG